MGWITLVRQMSNNPAESVIQKTQHWGSPLQKDRSGGATFAAIRVEQQVNGRD
jgi:hypothetical protein